jgi:1-deoxy-D-xylulose-5-phosphate reductoisomerase
MEIPISYCLNYPEITPNNGENISWSTFNSKLEFMEINRKLYPAFYLGKQVLAKRNQSQMIIYNIANEIAVERFINGYIKFIEIAEFIAKSLEIIAPIEIDSLDLTLDYIAHTTKQLKTI